MKINIRAITRSIRKGLKKHSPEILVGMGIAGIASTVVFACDATIKAEKLIKEKKDELEVDKLTKKEVVKTVWKTYILTAITFSTSVLCIIGASSEHAKRNAALAAAYTLSESTRKDYAKKVKELFGEDKEEEIQNSVIDDRVKKDPVVNKEVIITGNGETLCYDAWSGRYFRSDIERIKCAVNNINRQMLSDMYICLNEFYEEIGLTPSNMGYKLGWDVEKGLIDITFSSHLTEDGTPCLVMVFTNEPTYDF